MDTKYIVVFITVDSPETAQKITDKLLKERKTACVNIIPKVESHYWWQGKIESADELMLIVKRAPHSSMN
jgi:periplasmic divalent cation tolerance protein